MTNIVATDRYLYTNFLSGSPQLTRVPIDDPIGAEKWNLSYTTAPADMHEGGAPFGMAASRDLSIGKWVIIAGTYKSGIWKYVEP
jgi:hypothetical protein